MRKHFDSYSLPGIIPDQHHVTFVVSVDHHPFIVRTLQLAIEVKHVIQLSNQFLVATKLRQIYRPAKGNTLLVDLKCVVSNNHYVGNKDATESSLS